MALSNHRLRELADGQVTFSYRDSGSGETRPCTPDVEEFIRRFLQHVLPRGFVKVRYYGLFSAKKHPLVTMLRRTLVEEGASERVKPQASHRSSELRCPLCGRVMRWSGSSDPERFRFRGVSSGPAELLR